jgi:hypothetical protein
VKPLHQVLPSLETAVARRVACREINALDEGDLRDLIYKIVEHYQRQKDDPQAVYEDMARRANMRLVQIKAEQAQGARLRADVLDLIRQIAEVAMPAIGNPLRTKILRRGTEQQYTNHPGLRGVDLGGSRKQIAADDGTRAIAGRSWWVVVRDGDPCGCWAILDHVGSTDPDGNGEERIIVTPADPEEVAAQTNEKIVGAMLIALAQQLRDAEVSRRSPEVERQRTKLEAVLRVLQDG